MFDQWPETPKDPNPTRTPSTPSGDTLLEGLWNLPGKGERGGGAGMFRPQPADTWGGIENAARTGAATSFAPWENIKPPAPDTHPPTTSMLPAIFGQPLPTPQPSAPPSFAPWETIKPSVTDVREGPLASLQPSTATPPGGTMHGSRGPGALNTLVWATDPATGQTRLVEPEVYFQMTGLWPPNYNPQTRTFGTVPAPVTPGVGLPGSAPIPLPPLQTVNDFMRGLIGPQSR